MTNKDNKLFLLFRLICKLTSQTSSKFVLKNSRACKSTPRKRCSKPRPSKNFSIVTLKKIKSPFSHAQVSHIFFSVQSMQLDGLKKISFQRFVPSNPDNYIITNHSLLKRKTALASGNNIRRVNSALVLAEAPTPNDIARELMPKAKIAKLVAESSDATKALLKAFETGNFDLPPKQKQKQPPAEAAQWDDEFEEEREAARDAEKAAQPYETPQTKEQQTVEHVLRENSFFLYNLQAAQYQRVSGFISKAENSYATKIARNIADLGIVIPTTAIVSQNEVDKALRESDLVNDLVPTEEGGEEPQNENKSDVETKA